MYYDEGLKLFNQGDYMEALEKFTRAQMAKDNIEKATREIARCYFREERFLTAYKCFLEMVEADIMAEYALSMIASIKAYEGEYEEAIRTLKKMPVTINNTINLATFYYLQYFHDRCELSLFESKKILDKLEPTKLDKVFIWRVFLCQAMLHQAMGEYGTAERQYQLALDQSLDKHSRASILDELGSLYLELQDYEKAEQVLNEAELIVSGTNSVEDGLNKKWLGILHINLENAPEAKGYLDAASKILKDRRIFKELAAVNFYLSKLHQSTLNVGRNLEKQRALSKALTYYAEGVISERLAEEVKGDNEKITKFVTDVIDSFDD